jgi:hypothetical protein
VTIVTYSRRSIKGLKLTTEESIKGVKEKAVPINLKNKQKLGWPTAPKRGSV